MLLNLIWILAASLVTFSLAAVFAGRLRLRRNVYLLFYITFSAAVFIIFIITNDLNIVDNLTHNWYWGLIGAVLASAFVFKNVLSQPSSERNKGMALVSDILWPGFTYGLIDALLLSILPILAIRNAFGGSAWTTGWAGSIALGLIGLIASLFVTVIYHLGYPEFRGKNVIWPAIGNGVLSIAFLITGNPLAAILPHIGMHIMAMIHGRETTGQVPPHYTE